MNNKQIYSRPESEAGEYLLIQTLLEDSNTETFEGGNNIDLTW